MKRDELSRDLTKPLETNVLSKLKRFPMERITELAVPHHLHRRLSAPSRVTRLSGSSVSWKSLNLAMLPAWLLQNLIHSSSGNTGNRVL